jgi:methionyl-tRNA formyltransferase|tara:strand:- start:268 stop:1284 length:1017 start_codon:yes stop_codon:yes gene_type:complete
MNFGKIGQYILFGGGQLLCLTAKQLKKESYSVFVVTSERHSIEPITLSETSMPFIEFLQKEHVDYIISKDILRDSEVLNKITKDTIGISFGAAWIFKQQFIDLFKGRLLNCHGARLPQDRGAGGYSWRILRDERVGVSLIHQIDSGVDTGDIVLFKEFTYPYACRYPIDYRRYSMSQYQELLGKLFGLIKDGKSFERITQQEYFSSYWPRLATDIHGYIDWNWALKDIERFICAFDDPYNGASTFLNGRKVRLKKCYSSFNDGIFHPFQKGFIYRISEDVISIATDQGSLLVNDVFDENGVNTKQNLCIGDRFYTPMKYLEEAKQFRAVYTPTGLKTK